MSPRGSVPHFILSPCNSVMTCARISVLHFIITKWSLQTHYLPSGSPPVYPQASKNRRTMPSPMPPPFLPVRTSSPLLGRTPQFLRRTVRDMRCLIPHGHDIFVNLNLYLRLWLCVFDCVRHQIICDITKHLRIRLQLHISANRDRQLVFVNQILI